VTLDRPERRNAVDTDELDGLLGALTSLADCRVVVLSGEGEHFCAGADLHGVEDEAFRDRLTEVLTALRTLPVPTIAAVHGAALGAGMQLALACDLRVATADARFGIPAARLGLMVDEWTIRRAAMLCGQGPAASMLLAADVISGSDAHGLGLVQRIGDLSDALGWADELSSLAPLTIAGHKLALNRLEPEIVDDPEFDAAFRRAWSSADLKEGIAAFREGRRASFQGR
jgi:enoyl-CoA hydratase